MQLRTDVIGQDEATPMKVIGEITAYYVEGTSNMFLGIAALMMRNF